MLFDKNAKIKNLLRSSAQKIVPKKEEGSMKKFASEADFFGYSCVRLPARENNVYVGISGEVEAFSQGRYLFPKTDVLSQLFPGRKIYSLANDLYVFGGDDEVVFFETDATAWERFYAYLALYSAYKDERNGKIAGWQRRALLSDSPNEVFAELALKSNENKKRLVRGVATFPPLFGFPDGLIRALLKDAGETVCFPEGGVWHGLLPVLAESGVKRVILPRTEAENAFFVQTDKGRLDVLYGEIPDEETDRIMTYLGGYGRYPLVEDAEFIPPTEEGAFFSVLPPPVLLPRAKTSISDEGDPTGLIADEKEIGNGILSVTEKNGVFFLGKNARELSVAYDDGKKTHRCGYVAERCFLSGRFAVSEVHYYFRERTARARVMLENASDRLYIELVGDEGFTFACKIPDATSIVCRLPFADDETVPKNGVYRARDKIVVKTAYGQITLKSDGVTCKKEGDTCFVPLRSFVITEE